MSKNSLVYIATQDPQKMGVTIAEFDSATGTLSIPKMAIETRDPAHFTLSADGRHLYMCNTGTPGGISAFAVDRKTGGLTLQNYIESKGRGPSYVSVDQSGKYVLDANYGGGFVEVLSLKKDGSLGERVSFVQHIGSSVHPQRQSKPYAHWIRTDPDNRFALVADLGMDQIVLYAFDAGSGKLTPNHPPSATVKPGSGPRHLAFHPNGKWLYAVQEISNEVLAFNWDARKGTLAQFQAVNTLADTFKDASTAAEIAVRADGKFLYVTNRGEDTIVVYSIDARNGELSFRQRVPSGGKVPRYFSFDPTNQWLVVSNQEGGAVVVFAIDAQSGGLEQRSSVPLAKPMAVVFGR
ncbi:MAG TPA: lactonase family protein [Steroidobacteraceae bacterium]|nr:lactonase family protein [Steroidobacteraceae bacterium]